MARRGSRLPSIFSAVVFGISRGALLVAAAASGVQPALNLSSPGAGICAQRARSGAFPLSLAGPFRMLHAMPERMISEVLSKPDVALEMTLRPSLFSDFTGQAKVKERLEIA